MALLFKNFSALVNDQATAAQAATATTLDFSPGSVLLALAEANASNGLWLQYLLILLMQRQRLATSSGADVDSWVGDFGVARLPGVAATGTVTITLTAASSATIPVGATVRTSDASQTFTILADTTNAYYVSASAAYVVPVGITTISVPVAALTPGTGGNVVAGAINLFGTAIAGTYTVTNALAFTNGVDSESDASLQARFAPYLQSLTRGTIAAVLYAAQSVQQGVTCTVRENVNTVGAYMPGNFVVTADNGSGLLPSALHDAIYAAVDAVRPVGSTFAVVGPTITSVSISMTLTVAAGADKSILVAPVAAAVTAYVNGLSVGQSLSYNRLSAIIFGVDSNITNVTGLTVNGGTSDIAPGIGGAIVLSTVSVS